MTPASDRRTDCLDDETLAALLDDRLDQNARGHAEAHLSGCAECSERFVDATRLSADLDGPALPFRRRVQSRMRTWQPWLLAAAAMALLSIWVAPRWLGRDAQLNRAIGTILEAGAERPLEARLTGERAWRPVGSATRGTGAERALPSDARIALVRIDEALAAARTPAALSMYARSRLVLGEPDPAVATLEEATSKDATSPELWSDLAAAYLARSGAPERASDLPRALDAINRAIELDAARPESWFNKAVVLERLGMRDQAIAAWEQFLALDGDSPWAREARERLARLRASAGSPRTDAGPLRDRLFDTVLPAWARAVVSGADASASLEEAKGIVVAIGRLTAERFANDILDGIEAAQASGAESLARGVILYGDARAAYIVDRFETALPLFSEARQRLEAAGSPLFMSATVYSALSAYRLKDYDRAHAALASIRDEAMRRGYASVLGRIDWARGLMWLLVGRIHESAASYRSAIDALGRAGDTGNRAFVTGLLATNYDQLGDAVRLWQHRVEALRGSSREGVLLRAADEARRENWLHAAREFAGAAVDSSRSASRKALHADSLRWLAVIEGELGNQRRSHELLSQARTVIAGESGAAWQRLAAEIDLADAMASEGTPEAMDAAARALEYFRSTIPPSEERLPEVYLARASLARRLGRVEDATADLRAGIAVFSRMRAFVTPGVDQATLADVARRMSDQLVALLAATDGEAAFAEIEKGRAWDLTTAGEPAVSLEQLRERLPPSAIVMDFVVGDDASYVWIVGRERASLHTIPMGRREMAALVEAMHDAPDGDARDRLSAVLLAPLRDVLRPGDLLAVVPDGPLHLLPFAALRAPSGAYLVEEHPILLAPSASRLVQPRLAAPEAGPILAVGNPAFDRAEWPGLRDLPGAAVEAAAAAGGVRTATRLVGSGATRAALLGKLPSAAVFHFAGHAVVNDFTASDSSLVLAGRDRLTAGEIRRMRLPGLGLVVLASCDSARGFRPRSEGPLGLARAFHAAGAATVIASLWSVKDVPAEALFRRFYEELAAGRSAARALQAAQRQAIASSDPRQSNPRSWSNFVITGSLASFDAGAPVM